MSDYVHKPAPVNWHEVEELARVILNASDELSSDQIDELLVDEIGVDFEGFENVVKHLLPLAFIGKSGLTGKVYRSFAIDRGQGVYDAIIKHEP